MAAADLLAGSTCTCTFHLSNCIHDHWVYNLWKQELQCSSDMNSRKLGKPSLKNWIFVREKNHEQGEGGLSDFIKDFSSRKLKRPLCTVFVTSVQWIVQVWALKTLETLEFDTEVPKTHKCYVVVKKQCTGIFVAKIIKYALLSEISQQMRFFVAKITTYAHFSQIINNRTS